MKLFSRVKQAVVPSPPEGAHGCRNIDGSYFSVWMCQHGHAEVSDAEAPPERECFACMLDSMESWPQPAQTSSWRLATAQEAHDFLFKLEGFSMYDGVGFKLMPEVAHAS